MLDTARRAVSGMIRLTSIICDADDDVGDHHQHHAVLECSLSIAQIDQKIGIHCRKRSASWLLVGLHCWILRRTQCTMICRSGDGSTTTQLAGFWDDLVKSHQYIASKLIWARFLVCLYPSTTVYVVNWLSCSIQNDFFSENEGNGICQPRRRLWESRTSDAE